VSAASFAAAIAQPSVLEARAMLEDAPSILEAALEQLVRCKDEPSRAAATISILAVLDRGLEPASLVLHRREVSFAYSVVIRYVCWELMPDLAFCVIADRLRRCGAGLTVADAEKASKEHKTWFAHPMVEPFASAALAAMAHGKLGEVSAGPLEVSGAEC
jgi:hypothetical protein